MPACFRHDQQITGGEFESFNLVIHNNIEFSGAGDDVYQLVTGWMAFPTGVAVEAAEIDIGILEIAFAEGGNASNTSFSVVCGPRFTIGLRRLASSLILMISTMINVLRCNTEK